MRYDAPGTTMRSVAEYLDAHRAETAENRKLHAQASPGMRDTDFGHAVNVVSFLDCDMTSIRIVTGTVPVFRIGTILRTYPPATHRNTSAASG